MATNRFAKAAATTTVAAGKKKDERELIVPPDPTVRKAIDDFVAAKQKMKDGESEKKVADAVASPYYRKEFIGRFAAAGVQPEKLFFKGEQQEVQLISQDRGGVTDVSDEQLQTLKTLLGEKKAEGLIEEFTQFSLDEDILNLPGVADILSGAIDQLVSKKVLSQEQADKLLVPKARRIVKKGTVDRLAQICDSDAELMGAVTDALGSNFTIYIK